MTFPGSDIDVTVDFYETNLYITDWDKVQRKWTMQIGFIEELSDEDIENGAYGINWKENVLGLAPMTLTTAEGDSTTSNLD